MADTITTKLVLEFSNSDNGTTKFSYNYANPEVSSTDVKNLVAIIMNNAIWVKTLTAAKSAALVKTTSTNIDIVN